MPPTSNPPTPVHPSRPKGVAAISIYYFGSSVILVPLLLLLTRRDLDRFSQAEVLFISPILIVLSLGLWQMKNWARVSAALLTAVGLVAGVVSKFFYGFFFYGFTHEQLKEACVHYKAYDAANFATHLKNFAAEVSGDKATNYVLTARGLTNATEILKKMLEPSKA